MTLVKVNNNPVGKGFSGLFDEILNEFPVFGSRDWNHSNYNFPQVNIHETSDGYHLELNVPGRNKEDFNLSTENGLLTISYEKKEENKSDDYKTIRREFSYRSFKRSFNLDKQVNAEGIKAKYENGLLKIYLPKKEEVKDANKQITVD